jgi:hypothetical protein
MAYVNKCRRWHRGVSLTLPPEFRRQQTGLDLGFEFNGHAGHDLISLNTTIALLSWSASHTLQLTLASLHSRHVNV